EPEIVHAERDDHGLDARLPERIAFQTFEAGLAEDIAELTGRSARTVPEQPVADESLVENAEPASPRVALQPLRENVGPSMVRLGRRAVPIEFRVAQGNDRSSISRSVDLRTRQEWPGLDRLCYDELRQPRRVTRLRRHIALLQRQQVVGRRSRLLG